MAGQITLYKDSARTQALTDGLWTTAVDLGTATIPGSGSASQAGVACYGKNTGTTTIQHIFITPIAGGGTGGSQLAADVDIAADVTGAAGTYGADGTQVEVYPGSLGVAIPAPNSNTSGNIANPNTQPSLSVGSLSSNLPAGVYTVGYTMTNSTGETLVSPTANLTITAGQSIRVSAIALSSNATGIKYYMSYRDADTSLFYSATNGGGSQIDLIGAQGFFQFWVRQTVKSTDTPGIKQAKLQIDATDIG